MICPNCGKEAADGALFCTGCGGRLDNLPKQEKMTASENSNNDDSSVMDAVFTSDAADGTPEIQGIPLQKTVTSPAQTKTAANE